MCSEIIHIDLSYECVTTNPPPGLMMLNITAYFVATASYSSVRNRKELRKCLLPYSTDLNKRQMYGSAVHHSLTVIQIRDKCMPVSPPKTYCHTNKRQMYGSAVHPRLTVI